MKKVRTTAKNSVSHRARLLGAGIAIVLPIGVIGFAGTAHAESLDPAYSTTVAPTDWQGTSFPVTMQVAGTGTAWSVISTDPQFSTFAAIVKNAGLQSMFDGGRNGTFLTPSNQAFEDAGPDVVARLTDPANASAAANYVNSMVSNSTDGLLAYFRGAGAVDPTAVTSQTCTPIMYTDIYGNVLVTGQSSCVTNQTVIPLAAPVDHLNTLDGQAVDASTQVVQGTLNNGIRLSLGDGFVASATSVSNGVVDNIDTVNLTHYPAW